MIVPQDVAKKYSNTWPYLERVGQRARDVVFGYCEEQGYAFVSRYKTTASLAEKIETGRFSKWSDLNDLFACTIVIPTLQYEAAALDFLESRFEPVNIKARGAGQKNPNVFHFDSTMFTGRLRLLEGHEGSNFSDILFEVQIRSAFEHAWSVTTHALTYKGAQVDWRRLRLAAQLKATVEQLDNLILGFEETASVIPEQEWPEIRAKRAIEHFFDEQFTARLIPSESRPTNWTRFCDNVISMLKSSSGINDADLDEVVETAIEALQNEIHLLGLARFPRSVSLTQFVLGVLAKTGVLSTPLHGYVPTVTSELSDLYPAVEQFHDPFDFELT